MSDFSDELQRLRRGRGVMATDLEARIGPVLRTRAAIGDSDRPQQVRARFTAYATGLARSLPEDLGLAFSVGLALHPDARFRFLEQRMEWLANELSRDVRTARRRFDEAVILLDTSNERGGDQSRTSSAGSSNLINYQTENHYRPLSSRPGSRSRIGFVTGDIRRVKNADVWVNPENTQMKMARPEEHSVSAVIRYEGASRDDAGLIAVDVIADELKTRMGRTPQVAPGTAVSTGSGELLRSNNVRHVIHVAVVHGEPGEGYRQVADVGRCLANVLAEADRLGSADPAVRTVLVPLLGTGIGRADPEGTLHTLLGAVLNYFSSGQCCIETVLFLAYNSRDLAACRTVFESSPYLSASVD